jgi:hypothetical protein
MSTYQDPYYMQTQSRQALKEPWAAGSWPRGKTGLMNTRDTSTPTRDTATCIHMIAATPSEVCRTGYTNVPTTAPVCRVRHTENVRATALGRADAYIAYITHESNTRAVSHLSRCSRHAMERPTDSWKHRKADRWMERDLAISTKPMRHSHFGKSDAGST